MQKALLLLLPLLVLTSCDFKPPEYTPSAPQSTAGALNATYQAEATATWRSSATVSPSLSVTPSMPTATSISSASPLPSATATPTPSPTSSIVEVTPCGNSICEIATPNGDSDEAILARLCAVELRGMAEKRAAACYSVISTVLTRIANNELSDGTIQGTLTWGCTPEGGCTQFPGHVVNGCLGILPQACAWNYPDDIAYFMAIARDAINGVGPGGSDECHRFLYYDSRPTSLGLPGACVIRADNDQFEVFHNE